jgi:uncharacterized protein (TIRG00374 family)
MYGVTVERKGRSHVALRRGLQLFGLFLVIHFLLPLLGGLRSSVHVLSSANPWLVGLAVVLQAGSLLAYGQCARVLLPRDSRIGLRAVMRIELAMLALTHVLPGGAAASTPVGYRMFRRAGVPPGDAGFVLGLQGIGSAAVLSVLLIAVLAGSAPFRGLRPVYLVALVFGIVIVGGLVLVLVSVTTHARWVSWLLHLVGRRLSPARRTSLSGVQADLVANVRRLSADRSMRDRALGWVAAQWILDCASLWVFIAAFGSVIAPDKVFVAFGLSNIFAFIPVTPAGLGVFEAVLTSSLVSFGIPAATVVVAVLAYRLVEFWLPIPIGGVGYLAAMSGPSRDDEGLSAQSPEERGDPR